MDIKKLEAVQDVETLQTFTDLCLSQSIQAGDVSQDIQELLGMVAQDVPIDLSLKASACAEALRHALADPGSCSAIPADVLVAAAAYTAANSTDLDTLKVCAQHAAAACVAIDASNRTYVERLLEVM